MSCYLIIVYRKHYIFYRTLYNCTNQIHQAIQHTYFISCFVNPSETFVWCIFRFSNLFCLVFFFKLWLSLLLNMQKQWKNHETVESEEAKKKKTIFISKKEFVRVHLFMTSAKSLKFKPQPAFSPLCINTQFWSKRILLWMSLIRIQTLLRFNFAQHFLC